MGEVNVVAEMRDIAARGSNRISGEYAVEHHGLDIGGNIGRLCDLAERREARGAEAFRLIGDLRTWRRWHKPSVWLSRDDIPPNPLSEESLFRRIDQFINPQGDTL